jgi:hypothetical protein
MLIEESRHGRAAGASVHPYRQWRILGIVPRLKKPEEGIDVVCLFLACALQRTSWQMDVAGVRLDAWSRLADTRLMLKVNLLAQYIQVLKWNITSL